MVLWLMVIAQLIVWAWFSIKAGELSDKKFLIFTVGMLLGQLGAGIETYEQAAWRAFVVQGYFFFFTALGGVQRFRQMRRKQDQDNSNRRRRGTSGRLVVCSTHPGAFFFL